MQEEKYNTRDRSYSAWHRRKSTQRFIGIEKAQLLAMIDLDASIYVEYDDGEKVPLALIETAIDKGQPYKTAYVTEHLAKMAGLPCFVVLYSLSNELNPEDKKWFDIERFRVKRLYPCKEKGWRTLTPEQWAITLLEMRKWSASNLDKKLDDKTTCVLLEKEKEKKLITKIEQLSLFQRTHGDSSCSST